MNGLDLPRINGLSLFSGIGGAELALAPWVRTVAYCERDRHATAQLLTLIARGELPSAPIWDDVRTLRARHLEGVDIDVIFGGFPCQGISVAGMGRGLADERSGLFWQIVRLARELGPKWIVLENSPAIRTRGGGVVVGALASVGYDARWGVLSAFDVGAKHERDRFWLVARRQADTDRHRHRLEVESQRDCQEQKILRTRWHDLDGLRDALSDAVGEPVRNESGGGMGRIGQARPSLETMARHDMWPTPLARDYRSPGHGNRQGGPGLSTAAGGLLNPEWVEILMGYDPRWTEFDPRIASALGLKPGRGKFRASSTWGEFHSEPLEFAPLETPGCPSADVRLSRASSASNATATSRRLEGGDADPS